MAFSKHRQERIRSVNAMRFRRRRFAIELLEDRRLLASTLYYSANNQIRSVLDDGSADAALFAGDMPVASPNGQYLAFRRGTNPTTYFNDLWVRDLTNGTERLASIGTTSYIVGYSFTVDSKSLLFDYADDIRQYELANTSSSRLTIACLWLSDS